ncbi:MAG: hypothetical protein JST12_18490 [Armatimonadetes bacterium]|nr:hypothetical protein [Armatimonadota bacterium]
MATVTTTYITVNGILMQEIRGGTETYYTPDPLGNLTECRNSSGTRTYSAEYWPYGEIQMSTGENSSPWGFVGLLGYLTDTAAILYIRARYLTTQWVRWLTQDPLWPVERPYQYVRNNPTAFVDPAGLGKGFWDLIASCGTGLGNLFSDIMNGSAIDFKKIACDVGVPCALVIVDIIIDAYFGELGPLATCIAGAINGLIGSIFYNICNGDDPCKPGNSILCNLLNNLLNGLTGCLSNLLGSINLGLGSGVGAFYNWMTSTLQSRCKATEPGQGGLIPY